MCMRASMCLCMRSCTPALIDTMELEWMLKKPARLVFPSVMWVLGIELTHVGRCLYPLSHFTDPKQVFLFLSHGPLV